VLAESVRSHDPIARLFASHALAEVGALAVPTLVKALDEGGEDVRASAAAALAMIGPPAADAAEALVRALRDNVPGSREALVGIGLPAVPALKVALKDENADVRMRAVRALGRIGHRAQVNVPELAEMLGDRDRDVRIFAVKSLGMIGAPASESAAELAVTLMDKDEHVREVSAGTLRILDPSARSVLPALKEALENEDPKRRLLAVSALGRIGPAAKDAVSGLVKTLDDEDLEVRYATASALGDIGPAARVAIPALERWLRPERSRYPILRAAAAEALAKIRGSDE
jgi:HEAT repeat protein